MEASGWWSSPGSAPQLIWPYKTNGFRKVFRGVIFYGWENVSKTIEKTIIYWCIHILILMYGYTDVFIYWCIRDIGRMDIFRWLCIDVFIYWSGCMDILMYVYIDVLEILVSERFSGGYGLFYLIRALRYCEQRRHLRERLHRIDMFLPHVPKEDIRYIDVLDKFMYW